MHLVLRLAELFPIEFVPREAFGWLRGACSDSKAKAVRWGKYLTGV
jgi:hypothetical protein